MNRVGASLALVALLAGSGCAKNECNFNSQCGPSMYCRFGGCFQNCELDLDCDANEFCSPIGQCDPRVDAGPDSGRDSSLVDARLSDVPFSDVPMDAPPPFDAGVDAPSPMDAGADARAPDAGADAGPLGARLDPCTTGFDCASTFCAGGRCTVSCTRNDQCGDDEVCGGGLCTPDDTGAMCNVATPDTCALDMCLGRQDDCTRPCANAADCPAGFACSDFGGMKVCVEIEIPCDVPTDCAAGLCLSVQGCTASCDTAADCPARATALGVPAYTCEVAFGSATPICVPPSDVLGADSLGTTCAASGLNTCRSGLCNAEALGGPICTQSCTPEGGCPPGFGCKPEQLDSGAIEFFCARAGSLPVGDSCSRASDCETALCNAPGYCTRLCNDGLCPTGFRCDPLPRSTSRMCVRI